MTPETAVMRPGALCRFGVRSARVETGDEKEILGCTLGSTKCSEPADASGSQLSAAVLPSRRRAATHTGELFVLGVH